MALDINAIRNVVLSHAAASGYFEQVLAHEPKNAPGNGINFYCWLNRIVPARSGLASTSALVVFNIRIMTNMLSEPQDDIDVNLSDAASALFSAYSGDFELGGTASHIDLLGSVEDPMELEAGYVSVDSTMFRAYDITLPVVVNDVWSQSP